MTATHDQWQPRAAPTDVSLRRAAVLDACMGYLRCIVTAMAIFSIPLATAAHGDRPGGTAPSPGSTPATVETPAPGDHDLGMQWGGQQRTFRVHAPPSYDGKTPLPLVVAMHHSPGNADVIASTSDMSAKADREGFLVLYPEGLGGGMNALVCCGSQDDVGFVKALVERMVARWHADPQRVYATGISNGGDMAFRLAVVRCVCSDRSREWRVHRIEAGFRHVPARAPGVGHHLHRRQGPLLQPVRQRSRHVAEAPRLQPRPDRGAVAAQRHHPRDPQVRRWQRDVRLPPPRHGPRLARSPGR